MSLCIEKRGELTNQVYLTTDRVELSFNVPLAEIVFDFYDRLKSISKGAMHLLIIIQLVLENQNLLRWIFYLTEIWLMPFLRWYTKIMPTT